MCALKSLNAGNGQVDCRLHSEFETRSLLPCTTRKLSSKAMHF